MLAGALAPTLAPPGSTDGVNDLTFLQQMYDAGAADFFDMLAIHAYGWHFDPDDPADPEVINFRRAELQRAIMERNGDGHKQAMITEGGWNDHPRWTRAVRPGQRITYTLRAFDIAAQEWPWLDAICLWVFRFPWDQQSYQDYYTFVRTDFEPKPIYDGGAAVRQRGRTVKAGPGWQRWPRRLAARSWGDIAGHWAGSGGVGPARLARGRHAPGAYLST